MNNIEIEWKTIEERQVEIAKRFRAARKAQKISRKELSIQSGVPAPTIRRFEDTGNISLYALTALAVALGYKEDIDNMFKNIIYLDIRDMIKND